jgi:hypothetical protein
MFFFVFVFCMVFFVPTTKKRCMHACLWTVKMPVAGWSAGATIRREELSRVDIVRASILHLLNSVWARVFAGVFF